MSTKTGSPRSVAPQKQAVIEQELTRVRGRIRLLDVASVVLTALAAMLAYGLAMIVLDHFFLLGEGVRQGFLIVFLLGLAALVVWLLLPPLTRPVNPYYAARVLEKSLPDTRNGLVTWLDLHEKPLPPVIQEAVHKQAIKELQGVQVEQAVPSRWPIRLSIAVLLLLTGLFALRFVWPDQYGSLLQRAFLPFTPKAVPTFTRLQLKLPIEDEIVESPETAPVLPIKVEHRRPVTIAVAVEGRVPDSVWIEYTSSLIPTPVKRSLAPPDKDQGREYWTIILQEFDIPNDGLTFRIRGGDGMTRLYQLVVEKSRPEVQDLDITLEYPAYLRRPPTQQNYGRIRAPEGSSVRLTVTADQPVKHGFLEVRIKDATVQTLDLDPDTSTPSDDPRRPRRLRLTAPWVLTRQLKPQDPGASCTFRLQLVSVEGKSGWSMDYPLEVLEDAVPWAVIKQVGSQIIDSNTEVIQLPLNDVAPIRGMTGDDHAVREVRMRLRTVPSPDRPIKELNAFGGKPVDQGSEGKGLQQPRPFAQPPEEFQLILDLGKLTDNPQARQVEPFPLKVGDRLELWVEPVDYREPQPNVGKSKPILIELTEPLNKEEQQEKQEQAQQQQQQFDQQRKEQQERRDRQNQADQQPQDQQQQEPKEGQQPKDQQQQQQQQPKDGQQPKDAQQQPMQGEQKDPMPKEGQQPKDQQQQQQPKDGQQPKDAQQQPMQGEQKDPMPKEGQQPKDQQQQQQQQPKDGQQPKDSQQQPMQGEQKDPKPKEGQQPKDQQQQQQQQPKDGQQPKDAQQQPMQGEQKDPMPKEGQQPKDQQQQPKEGQQPKDAQQQPMQGEQKDPMPKEGQQPKDQQQRQEPRDGQKPNDQQQQQPKDGQQNEQQQQREMTPEQRREAEETARKADELAEALRRAGQPDANNPDRRPANPKDPDWKPDPTNPQHQAKATDLMLESFKEKLERGEIDKEVLKRMKWSEEDARRFLDQYQRLKDQGLLDQVRATGHGKTTGVGRSATEVRSQRDLNVDPGLLPPPQLRSAWENLTRKRAAPPK
ncbi:MAG: hypothetical protein NZM31_07750 [Gemmatales bacterium]|nr:hypothetical protein [Gemmatales bacterium]MDW8386889.1 hypothetical protein [Gemmatales bacterium]